jgi:hypothetical protein
MRLGTWKFVQAISCAVCAGIAWLISSGLGETEFSGGRITGPLLNLNNLGILLFAAAVFLTFLVPRIAAALGITASLISLPLYFYLMAPGPFRRMFPGEYSVPLQANFVWARWLILGTFAIGVTVSVCVWNFWQTASSKRNAAKT